MISKTAKETNVQRECVKGGAKEPRIEFGRFLSRQMAEKILSVAHDRAARERAMTPKCRL